ncbi:MAG: PepSY domain-containing protein [Ilumatobacteraceae bacterium]
MGRLVVPLHTGDFGGTVTRVLWTALALAPLALGVTGVWMNLIGRRKRAVDATGMRPMNGDRLSRRKYWARHPPERCPTRPTRRLRRRQR